ncbi:PIG-L family deacetylase [Stenotrophomonas phage vB_SmaS_DLP_5]|uniref:PIG-L family deacetylase n=1 Tax=Stenotrophomonas phage vB_SmaS_DLP_5 TaxID=2044561 RepID=A0A2D2W2P2_9CAUD|nr:PIG-L family deacetylase [Stenotrophomonas phage vB_SmaS_DLP_5]ATS92320.1 PIG-L family deacetylase [Stenotrophomonas phage vB_SmaS_DLP_5]
MKSLVIVPHMDDEVLSCGGLIQNRTEVRVLVVYGRHYPELSGQELWDKQAEQIQHFNAACGMLKVESVVFLNMPEGEPHQVGYYRVLEQLESRLKSFQPEEVVFPGEFDQNQDHVMLNHVGRILMRPGNLGNVKRVLKSIAHDSILTQPTYFVPMNSNQMKNKLNAMRCYEDEVRENPHPRSLDNIEALARVHGSKCGHEFAEGYITHMIKE